MMKKENREPIYADMHRLIFDQTQSKTLKIGVLFGVLWIRKEKNKGRHMTEEEIERIVEEYRKKAEELFPDITGMYTASEFAKISGRSLSTIYRLPDRKKHMSLREYVIRMHT